MNGSDSGESFLIVEDEPVTRDLISAFLDAGRDGLHSAVSSAAEAERVLNARGHELTAIICDHDLGGASGIDLLGRIRSGQLSGAERSLPFIMLTAHGDEQIIKTALSLDVHAYLMKPVSQKQMLHCLDKALTRDVVIKSADHYKSVLADSL